MNRAGADGVSVYSAEAGIDHYEDASGWEIDSEYNLRVTAGSVTVAVYRPEAWDVVNDMAYERSE